MTPLESLEAEVKRLREALEDVVNDATGCVFGETGQPTTDDEAWEITLWEILHDARAALQPRTAEETKERTWTLHELGLADMAASEECKETGYPSGGHWPAFVRALQALPVAAPRPDEGGGT